MPRKKRYRADGSIVKRFDSQANATPAVKYIGHGGYSGLLKDRYDLRSEVGRAFISYKAALIQHLGGEENVSTPELILVDMAARLQAMARAASVHMQVHEELKPDGSAVPAFDVYLRAIRELRSILDSLGLRKREKDVGDLATYLRERYGGKRSALRIKGDVSEAEEVE
jgi:hypothetical protein